MSVRSGVNRDQEVILNAGFIEVFGPAGASWTLFRADTNGAEMRAASEARAETTFLVAEGTYIAEMRLDRDRQRRELDLVAGETVTIDLRQKRSVSISIRHKNIAKRKDTLERLV